MERYIDLELDVDDYLQKLDMSDGWQPRGTARIVREEVSGGEGNNESKDGEQEYQQQKPPPALPIDEMVPRTRRAATSVESSSSENEDSSEWYNDSGSERDVIYGQMPPDDCQMPLDDELLMPGTIPMPPAPEETEALIADAAERERQASMQKDQLRQQKLQSWKQNRHQVVAMPPSLTTARGAHRLISASV